MVRQELASELGIVVCLRTVERSLSYLRRELAAEALAMVRFETPPGRQWQMDFGQRRIAIEGEDLGRVFLFVATLGYSRWVYAAAFRHERQSAWLEGTEGAFRHFGVDRHRRRPPIGVGSRRFQTKLVRRLQVEPRRGSGFLNDADAQAQGTRLLQTANDSTAGRLSPPPRP